MVQILSVGKKAWRPPVKKTVIDDEEPYLCHEDTQSMRGFSAAPVKSKVPEPGPMPPVPAPHSSANSPLASSCVRVSLCLCVCLCTGGGGDTTVRPTGTALTERDYRAGGLLGQWSIPSRHM